MVTTEKKKKNLLAMLPVLDLREKKTEADHARTTIPSTPPPLYFIYFFKYIFVSIIYGVVKPIENNKNSMNVYVVSFEENVKHQFQSLGTWNTDDLPNHHGSLCWIRLVKDSHYAKIESVKIEGVYVPPSCVTLILYDETFPQSEILEQSEDWKNSKCLCELGSFLRLKNNNTVKRQKIKNEKVENSIFNRSKVVLQLRQRALQWKAWRGSRSDLISTNLLWMMVIDLILGFCFVKMFHSLGGSNEVLEKFLKSVKVIADYLQLLIEWLMGVPVGLKLNRPLSTVLGKFFLYHLYLWKTYIDIIRPIVSTVIFISSTVGLIGLSFQMALLSDLITMASLHCYCFYVYATRLYGITLSGLRSTFRMFGGRKWNPLRSRIDSGEFSWDQLCVGMFIFSSLLLLLPTLLVYYIVFLALRLCVLFVQGTLKRLIWIINSLPCYSLLLWILGSPSLAGDVFFEVIPGRDSTLKLVWIKLPLVESMIRSLNPSSPQYPHVNWSQRLNEMVSGDLIYPS
uniref:EOG090X0BA1 n=1 Tax=Daphnia hispanica TaxID=575233 RepID=A0A4Y7M885_9CRUS|nr:EOG090X0BA1 [Daphnia hispanica]